MPKISIDKAQPGLVVIKKVENDKGMVLLPPGTKLNDVLIARLKKWNVQTIEIEETELSGEEAVKAKKRSEEIDQALKVKLENRFKPVLDDPIMKSIYEALKQFYQEQNEGESS